MEFEVHEIHSWPEFVDFVSHLPGEWAYRGQCGDWCLKTSLERSFANWDVDLSAAPGVEQQIIRDFRRQYQSETHDRVNSDTLFCLALMQHHGAPTRLLDWTYSPFVAAKFAVEAGGKEAVVWCINTAWSYEAAAKVVGRERIGDTLG